MTSKNIPVRPAAAEEVRLAEDILQEVQKTKRQMRMYPPNNPMYIKASKTLHQKFTAFFDLRPELVLKIDKYEIVFHNEPVYASHDKTDNLALFFFKDGIRLLSFRKGISPEELRDFISILNVDFESDALDDDVVTILWERDFENIKYVVDENFLSEWDIPEKGPVPDNAIQSAHADGLKKEKVDPKISVHIDDTERLYMANEIEQQKQPKTRKVITILFEALTHADHPEDIKRIAGFMKDTIFFCVEQGDFYNAAHTLDVLENCRRNLSHITAAPELFDVINESINGEEFAYAVLKILESDAVIESSDFASYTDHLSKSVIPFFMEILGEVQKMKNRRMLIDTLSKIGRNDIHALAKGLRDTKWYVARNSAVILGNIATIETVPYLVESLSHEDQRVRREVVKALGNSGSPDIIDHIRTALQDQNFHVRNAAAKALGNIQTEEAKQLILREISSSHFLLKELNEKKEFFTALANWRDSDVSDFMIKVLNTTKILKKTKNDESRACAAYALGIIGHRDATQSLEKACKSGNVNLRRYASNALKKLKDDSNATE